MFHILISETGLTYQQKHGVLFQSLIDFVIYILNPKQHKICPWLNMYLEYIIVDSTLKISNWADLFTKTWDLFQSLIAFVI